MRATALIFIAVDRKLSKEANRVSAISIPGDSLIVAISNSAPRIFDRN
jgi:hypothetical protein